MVFAAPVLIFSLYGCYDLLGIYKINWSDAKANDFVRLLFSTIFSWLVFLGLHKACDRALPRNAWYFMAMLLYLFYTIVLRGGIHFSASFQRKRNQTLPNLPRVLIIANDPLLTKLVKNLSDSVRSGVHPVFCLGNGNFGNLPGEENWDKMEEVLRRCQANMILIALPEEPPQKIADLLHFCCRIGYPVRIWQSTAASSSHPYSLDDFRRVQIGDLVARPIVKPDMRLLTSFYSDKKILIVGAGTHMGLQLIRRLGVLHPSHVILYDTDVQRNAFAKNICESEFPFLSIEFITGYPTDEAAVTTMMKNAQPNILLYALASDPYPKETDPWGALQSILFACYTFLIAAEKINLGTFLFLSSDRAVRPTTIVGSCLRICEMLIQIFASRLDSCCSVRFGSVIAPDRLFPNIELQAERAPQVLLPSPGLLSYTMTGKDAAWLCLTAAALCRGGELFTLDQGTPLRVLIAAENLIRLSGREPYLQVPICFTGQDTRVDDEFLLDEEGVVSSVYPHLYKGTPLLLYEERVFQVLNQLHETLQTGVLGDMMHLLHKLVPTLTMAELSLPDSFQNKTI